MLCGGIFATTDFPCVLCQAVVPLLEGLEVDSSTYRLGLSQVIAQVGID